MSTTTKTLQTDNLNSPNTSEPKIGDVVENHLIVYSDEEIREARSILWEQGILEWKLDPCQKKIFDFLKSTNNKTLVVNASRRLGKCIAEGSEVMTPSGPVPIEQLKIGDTVYGWNKDGSVSETIVTDFMDNGVKEVYEFTSNTNLMAECTLDHVWLMNNDWDNSLVERPIGKMTSRNKIIRKFVSIPGGSKNVPHAYAIGALLGDGCSKQKYNSIHISSENELIPKKVAEILNLDYRHSGSDNHTWYIGNNVLSHRKINNIAKIEFYNEWCNDRYAHEKIIDLNEIKTWNRQSRLALLSGLIDTDGSIAVTSDNCLKISFCSQSYSLNEAFQYLYYSLFQHKPKICKENRNKYKNGPMYQVNIKNNLFNKIALKELDPYIQTPRKKWKDEYSKLVVHNSRAEYVGLKRGKSSFKKTYDITVNNETHLFLMANGLVTHNSYALVVLAFEQCIKFPKSIVKFIQPEVSMIRKNIRPIFDEIIFDCPPELSPEFKTQDNIYQFPNGSQIQLAGTDNGNYMKLRGGNSHLAIIDEAGFCTDLNHIINQILIPTTTLTKGKIILSSTTPDKMDHEFNEYMVKAENDGRLIRKTIYDAIDDHKEMEKPRITIEIIEDIIKGYNDGADAQEFKTEYLCLLPENVSSRVIPEFTKELEQDVVSKWVRPPFYDAYVSMDIGFVDLTAVLFGYYDFSNGVLVIEDEFSINGPKMTSRKLAEMIMETEDRLYTNAITGEFVKPYMRVSDNNMILLNDLQREYNLTFLPTEKHNKDAYINQLRTMIGERRIIINPKCTQLISHLKLATWEKSRKDYKRSADSGHYDFIDALVYMVRNLDMQRNPYPKGFHHSLLGSAGNVFKGHIGQNSQNKGYEKLEDMFKVKSTFKRTK